MLARYRMSRGVPAAQLPQGIRQDTRRHTRHVLRPEPEFVQEFFDHPTDEVWRRAMNRYRTELERRFAEDRSRFDALADLARREDVYLGCSCRRSASRTSAGATPGPRSSSCTTGTRTSMSGCPRPERTAGATAGRPRRSHGPRQ